VPWRIPPEAVPRPEKLAFRARNGAKLLAWPIDGPQELRPQRRTPDRGYRSQTNNQLRKDMATKLEKTLKREIDVDGKAYMLAISPEGLKVTEKGRRKGQELSWKGLLNGQAAAPSAALGGAPESETAGADGE
jgi:hypothetical protein